MPGLPRLRQLTRAVPRPCVRIIQPMPRCTTRCTGNALDDASRSPAVDRDRPTGVGRACSRVQGLLPDGVARLGIRWHLGSSAADGRHTRRWRTHRWPPRRHCAFPLPHGHLVAMCLLPGGSVRRAGRARPRRRASVDRVRGPACPGGRGRAPLLAHARKQRDRPCPVRQGGAPAAGSSSTSTVRSPTTARPPADRTGRLSQTPMRWRQED